MSIDIDEVYEKDASEVAADIAAEALKTEWAKILDAETADVDMIKTRLGYSIAKQANERPAGSYRWGAVFRMLVEELEARKEKLGIDDINQVVLYVMQVAFMKVSNLLSKANEQITKDGLELDELRHQVSLQTGNLLDPFKGVKFKDIKQ